LVDKPNPVSIWRFVFPLAPALTIAKAIEILSGETIVFLPSPGGSVMSYHEIYGNVLIQLIRISHFSHYKNLLFVVQRGISSLDISQKQMIVQVLADINS
jgi:hypothetical protein